MMAPGSVIGQDAAGSVLRHPGMDRSPPGVRATAGTLRTSEGGRAWHNCTYEGVVAAPQPTAPASFPLSVALCALDDLVDPRAERGHVLGRRLWVHRDRAVVPQALRASYRRKRCRPSSAQTL
jgi:hypothetical protein